MEGTEWIYVSLPYATFLLGVSQGRVVEAAPIARWALGRSERAVAGFYRGKGATFVRLPVEQERPRI